MKLEKRWHLMLAASVTSSGFQPRLWAERLVKMLLLEGKRDGPAMCRRDGNLYDSATINREFKERLDDIQSRRPDLIHPNIEVHEVYNIRRSLRRGSVTTAREAGVKEPTIDLVNRWSGYENRGGRRGGQKMRDHYTEIRMMRKGILKYSQAL